MYHKFLIAAVIIVLLTAAGSAFADSTFQNLHIFNGVGESHPTASIVVGGNSVYVATSTGVFVYNTSTAASFTVPVANPTSLAVDGQGNVYGTSATDYSIFKIAAGTSTLSIVRTFTLATAPGSLVASAAGNIYGQTGVFGSAPTLFSLTTGGTFTTYPSAGSYASPSFIDGQGNVVGVNPLGGSGGVGSIFALNPVNGNVTMLAQFTGANGYYPSTLTHDVVGNIYGFDNSNVSNTGSVNVFKVVVDSGTPITAATAISNGFTSVYGLSSDPTGNLFGTTDVWQASDGRIFEIPIGSSTVKTTALFRANSVDPAYYNGTRPINLIEDVAGNFFGITMGADSVPGTLFELSGADGAGASAPEPATLGILGLGIVTLCCVGRRSRR